MEFFLSGSLPLIQFVICDMLWVIWQINFSLSLALSLYWLLQLIVVRRYSRIQQLWSSCGCPTIICCYRDIDFWPLAYTDLCPPADKVWVVLIRFWSKASRSAVLSQCTPRDVVCLRPCLPVTRVPRYAGHHHKWLTLAAAFQSKLGDFPSRLSRRCFVSNERRPYVDYSCSYCQKKSNLC